MRRLFCIGCLMGLADLLPGISGGTIAFLTNIYERWLQALKSIRPKYLFSFQIAKFFEEIDWKFLIPLFSGIGVSIASFSWLIHLLLNNLVLHKLLYVFFIILIVISGHFLSKDIPKKMGSFWTPLIMGFLISFFFFDHFFLNLEKQTSSMYIFMGGMIASFAMLLPGISGSSMLIMLKLYEPLIHHLHNLFSLHVGYKLWFFLGSIAFGIIVGLMIFSRLVLWIYHKHKDRSTSFFIGLMVGSCMTYLSYWVHFVFFAIFFVCSYLLLRKFLFNRIIISK